MTTISDQERSAPDPRRDAPSAVDGPNPTAGIPPYEGTANPSTAEDIEADPIDPRDADWTGRATWHLREIGRLEHDRFVSVRAFDKEIERLEEQRDRMSLRYQKSIDWHTTPLQQLHRAILADDPQRKTITLPYGELASRTPKTPTVRVQNTEAFMAWAHVNAPHLLAVTFRPDRKHIAAAVGDTLQPIGTPTVTDPAPLITAAGEMVPGVVFGLDAPTFVVRTEKDW